jgi:hypothetical protein
MTARDALQRAGAKLCEWLLFAVFCAGWTGVCMALYWAVGLTGFRGAIFGVMRLAERGDHAAGHAAAGLVGVAADF